MAPRTHHLARKETCIGPLGVVNPPPIAIRTPTFDGSLVTLFACVRDGKVDLLEIPLMPICEAYFEYLLLDLDVDLDSAAAAMAALAYLIERKAWALLPTAEPEPEPEAPLELPEATVGEYSLAISALQAWQDARSRLFFRSSEAGPNPYELPYSLGDVTVADLAFALQRLLDRAERQPERQLSKPRRSLSEQMRLALLKVCAEWRTLGELVEAPFSRSEAVYWFLALLELIRLGQVALRMDHDDVRFARA